MKKSIKGGFVMAETIIISVSVLTALLIIYVQFINVNNSYDRTFRYNTVDDLYAVNNIKNFILSDDFESIVNSLENNSYVDLSNCSNEYFREYNYCNTLFRTLNVKSVILTYENVDNLKNSLKQNNTLSEGMYTFIKTISSNKNNKYRLIVEFKDNRYATLKLGSFIVSNISDICVKANNRCSLEQIKGGVSLSVAVNDSETYSFNVLKDDGNKLTLIMNDSFSDNISWNNTNNTQGPLALIDYLSAKVANWSNIPDITYSLNGTNASNYNGCSSINSCTSNTYTIDVRSSKAKLPILQDLTSLGCTLQNNSCPSWLNKNIANGYWTSTASNDGAYIVSTNNKVLGTNVNANNIKIRPVIVIDKDIVK